jgi:hypothetical protein
MHAKLVFICGLVVILTRPLREINRFLDENS